MLINIIIISLLVILVLLVIYKIFLDNKKPKQEVHLFKVDLKRREISKDTILNMCNNQNVISSVQDVIYNFMLNYIDRLQYPENDAEAQRAKIEGMYELKNELELYIKTGEAFKANNNININNK